mmetsp:Transcript_25160/g.42158  ORF Transcript_25160/g.42158 Transcript_25160/m.42158 type:complete len:101 (-) Transcript_25160:126-428(-)
MLTAEPLLGPGSSTVLNEIVLKKASLMSAPVEASSLENSYCIGRSESSHPEHSNRKSVSNASPSPGVEPHVPREGALLVEKAKVFVPDVPILERTCTWKL